MNKSIFQIIYDFIGAPLRLGVLSNEAAERFGFTSITSERINNVLPLIKGELLDIGCGDNRLVRSYGNGIGVDAHDADGGAVIIENTAHIPFGDGRFDTITFLASLNHIPNRVEVIDEAMRLLKDDGQVIVTMINPLLGGIGHKIWWYDEHHKRQTHKDELDGMWISDVIALMNDRGFTLARHKRFVYGLNNAMIFKKRIEAGGNSDIAEQTIKDFGQQWTKFTDNDGYYGSLKLFEDMWAPLVNTGDIKGKRAAEIGSGTGRITNMLLEGGAVHVTAIEPSEAFTALAANTKRHGDKVTLIKATGEKLPPSGDMDYVFSFGVIHHIPEPAPPLTAAFNALRPGGTVAIWVYGKEGNELYLTFMSPLRALARVAPEFVIMGLVWVLYFSMELYRLLCRAFPLPLRKYILEIAGRLSPDKRRLVIYDQLKPAYAKYYKRGEVVELLANAGFTDVKTHHRHGYSWTATGVKPTNN